MAESNSYTLQDGLSMLNAIIETDGKVMSAQARQACREIIADIRSQLADDSFRNFKMSEAQILEYAAKRFEQMHGSRCAKRSSRGAQRVARV